MLADKQGAKAIAALISEAEGRTVTAKEIEALAPPKGVRNDHPPARLACVAVATRAWWRWWRHGGGGDDGVVVMAEVVVVVGAWWWRWWRWW